MPDSADPGRYNLFTIQILGDSLSLLHFCAGNLRHMSCVQQATRRTDLSTATPSLMMDDWEIQDEYKDTRTGCLRSGRGHDRL